VEDEEALLQLTKLMLQRLGYEVIACGTVDCALEALRTCSSAIHLLMTDLIMPGMDGAKVAEFARQLNPQLKTLFISGHPQSIMAHLGVGPEEGTFLQKPFSLQTLSRAVREALE
jgi:DNA-binding NtrC family response regulator